LEGKEYDKNNNIILALKEVKGFIKEYDEDRKLIFEGEYLNGEKNGIGKEYSSYFCGNLILTGEYVNGERNGKGKEDNSDGELEFEVEYLYGYRLKRKDYINEKLEYEGEYLFDKKYNGKGYYENGNIIYELKNGTGKVKEYFFGKLLFEGEYLNGKRNGKGKEFNPNDKLKFEGEYLNGK